MAELYPTPSRLKLLKAAGEQAFNRPRIYGEANEFWDAKDGRKVTNRVREQIRVGWLQLGERSHGRDPVRPTPAGEAVLKRSEVPDA